MTVLAVDAPHNRTTRQTALLLLILAAMLLCYLPALRAGWVWDDDHYVTGNIHLRTLHGLKELWLRPGAVPQYYPVTHTTFWLEYHLWGARPLGYHLDNILLHFANAVLLWRILRKLGLPGCWLAALIFALHPVEVESVAWVTERKNVLSGFFYLLALGVGLQVWKIAARPKIEQSSKAQGLPSLGLRKYFLCLFLFVLALLSKSVTASFPAIILVLIWWKRGRVTWREGLSLAPFFVLGAAMGAVTSWMEKHVVGAMGSDWDFSFMQRLLIASHALWFYLAKIVWPHPLSFVYGKWFVDTQDWGSRFWVAATVVVAMSLLLLRNRANGLRTAALYFAITLVPALGFVSVYPMRYSFVADHFQYLASIGPIVLIAYALHRWRPVAVGVLVVLGVLTFRQCRIYANAETLWRDVVQKDPNSPIGLTDLGNILQSHGDWAGAEDLFNRALAAHPGWTEAQLGLGSVAEARSDFDKAMGWYRDAMYAAPDDPRPPAEMGRLYRRMGNTAMAASEFERAARKAWDPSPAYWEWGQMEMSAGKLDEAVALFKRALTANPDCVSAYNDLAAIDLTRGDLADAEVQSGKALEINPDDVTANNNMGVVSARTGNPDRAAEYFRRALEIEPGFESAKENLERLGRRPL